MTIASWGFAPALAAGNAVLVKPAECDAADHDPARRAGGRGRAATTDLLQVLPGKGAVVGERFVTHPDVRKIVFTGSTEVGKKVMAGAAAQVKRVTLELGGKSANIVFADCDLERAAATAPAGVFDNAGQDCCARSRILVQRSVYDRFMELLEPAVKRRRRRRPGIARHRDGPAGVGRAPRQGGVLCARRRPRRVPRQRADRSRILVSANGSDSAAHRPHASPTRSSARSSRCWPSTTSTTPSRWPTTPLRTVRIDLDRRPVPRAAGVACGRIRQPVGEFALVGALQHPVRRVQAVGAGPRARARTRRCTSPRPRTCSSRSRED